MLLVGTAKGAAKSRVISQGEGGTGFDAVVSRVLFGYLGLLLPIALFVVYAFAVQSVANIMKELEDAGYVMDIAPTRIPKQISGICILGLFFAAALL